MVRKTMTRAELHQAAVALADQYQLVKHNAQLFIPVSWFLPVVNDVQPDPKETIWLPLTQEGILQFGNDRGQILFQNTGEFNSFQFMLMQEAKRPAKARTDEVLIKIDGELRVLDRQGQIVEPSGEFVPNVLGPAVNNDAATKDALMSIFVDWLGDEDPVRSLLHHLATALAPGWSASKLVLLLGAGRNGKSTLLKMLEALLGEANVSHVTRQQMATREPAIVDLNNKLANIVYDASSTYLADSSTEKTLVVGEKVGVRLLYASTNTDVWTNGLFLEGLNEEPKSRDKTNALQRRIVRFYFPKEYPLDKAFEMRMLSEEYLGAFLSLLLDHYVTESEQATKLVPSQASYDLQVDQLWANSRVFQWLHELAVKDPGLVQAQVGKAADEVAGQFHAWLMGGKDEYSAVDAYRMLKECFVLKRVSRRVGTTVKKVWVLDSLTPDAARMIQKMTEEEPDDGGVLDGASVVED